MLEPASAAEQQAISAGADLLHAVMAEVAAEYGLQFVDVTRRTRGTCAEQFGPARCRSVQYASEML